MNHDEYEQWVATARARAQASIDVARERFGLGTYARYETDLSTAAIHFFDEADVEQMRADIQLAGSWSPDSSTWMWGWENESAPDVATERLNIVREAGRKRHLNALLAHVQQCDEDGAWNLASLAADLTEAQCLYRIGGARNKAFLLLFNLRRTA